MKLKMHLLAVLCFIPIFSTLQCNWTAWAGTVNLPQTGQTQCWDAGGNSIACTGTGQDGAIQAGVAWPSPRFAVNSDGTMTDNLTGLVWAKDAGTPSVGSCTGGTLAWTNALDHIACLNAANYLGHNDWRLPNVNEMASLVNYGQSNIAAWLGTQGFINAQSDYYWSSSNYSVDSAWQVNMVDGAAYSDYKTGIHNTWPVRGGASGASGSAVWKTGQTQSYYPGDDGSIQAGVAWPSPRFTDGGDGTVTDKLTGLTWTKDAGTQTTGSCTGGTMAWTSALAYVACLNTANYLGHADWRLPNEMELRSLVDYSQMNEALTAGNPFTGVQSSYYWSSSTYAGNPAVAWDVNMFDGNEYAGSKPSNIFVWPVRGGQVGHHPVRDFNGDGMSDILLRSTDGTQVAEWLMNGTTNIGGGYVSTSLDSGWQIK